MRACGESNIRLRRRRQIYRVRQARSTRTSKNVDASPFAPRHSFSCYIFLMWRRMNTVLSLRPALREWLVTAAIMLTSGLLAMLVATRV